MTPIADLILHPVRMRILQSLAGGRSLTPHQIAERLADVPHATLYRHVKLLWEAGVLKVVEETPIRGTVERTYALSGADLVLTPEDVAGAGPEEHLRYFTTFLTTLIGDFERYVRQPQPAFGPADVAYRQSVVHLTDEEYLELAGLIGSYLSEARAKDPAPGRRLRRITLIAIPEPENGGADE